ncbi:hypothetical protein ACUY3K_00300 [Corynebacterium uberis]|nr:MULTISPECIES: hypothetical protein [Corynebacterium]
MALAILYFCDVIGGFIFVLVALLVWYLANDWLNGLNSRRS